jgi:hypothetical protein
MGGIGVLHGLLGVFVGGLVIFFSVANGGRAMGVGGLLVQLRGALVRIVWHVL